MPFCDFIEIGTSDFNTEIEKKDGKIGISVEPIQYYLERIPHKEHCIKLNRAVSNYNGTCTVYYLSEETIRKCNFPDWVRGCNSINSYHKTVSNMCKNAGIDIEKISEKDSVEVMTLYQIMKTQGVDGVYFLKIDTEGHDPVILRKFDEELDDNKYLPHVIQFESNVLSAKEDVEHIIELFTKKGYDVIEKRHDTLLKLNLQKIENKTTFTSAIHKYYIMGYPDNYNIRKLPHENTLESAKEYCVRHNCSGITLQNGIYQVRGGKYMQYYNDAELVSWIFI